MRIRERSRRNTGRRSGRRGLNIRDARGGVFGVERQPRIEFQQLTINRDKFRTVRRIRDFSALNIRQIKRTAPSEQPANAIDLAKFDEVRGRQTGLSAGAGRTAGGNRLFGANERLKPLKALSGRGTVGGTAIKYTLTDKNAETIKINEIKTRREAEKLFESLDKIIR